MTNLTDDHPAPGTIVHIVSATALVSARGDDYLSMCGVRLGLWGEARDAGHLSMPTDSQTRELVTCERCRDITLTQRADIRAGRRTYL